MLKTETILLINYLHQTKEKDTEKIILSLDESRKKLWYEISVINNFLVEGGLQPIESHAGQLFYQDEETEKWTKLLVEQELDSYQFPEERIPLLIIHIACSQQPLSAKKLQNYFRLSRSSVLADVKRLRDYIEDYELVLLYDKAEGYIFKGDEMKVRRLLENAISHLQHISYLKKSAHYFEVIWGKSLEINEHYAYILNYSKNNLLSFVESRLEELIYNICFNKIRKNTKPINFSKNDTQQLKDQPAYTLSATLVKDIFNHSNEAEILFWETRLLNVLQGEKYTVDAHYFNKLTAKIILHIQQITGINFSESTTLHKTLYQHLVPAYFRMKFDLYYENPLVDKVKKEYHNLFYPIKKGLEPLEQEIGKCVSESEIAYFTIHFGGYLHLKEKTEENTRLRALAICLNGISSSLVMTAGLREIFPEIDFIEQHSIQEALLMSENQYDLVFSTISFPSEKKVYITKPLPNSNVTAIFTLKQVEEVVEALQEGVDSIVSVFAGRIADSGRDPIPMMKESAEICHRKEGVQLLWASPREVLNIIQAQEVGADIITCTPDLINKTDNFGKDLEEFSLDTVKMFFNDSKELGFSVLSD